ncbi:hypothetical protein DEO72_LG11g375 [Vigna unguiculata]|uniref:Uncharacterized protein n=1 Tax=Vigna unguiculata TaxID=3917 RepID=A0A4D6NK06_VIGUN|nr:hypothetical protein DEO72_LG11g375 [Vigna unguiculata]
MQRDLGGGGNDIEWHGDVPSLLHHRSVVPQASSIVVVIEVAESPLLLFNLASRLFYIPGNMNEGVVRLFRRDAVVENGGDNTPATFRV